MATTAMTGTYGGREARIRFNTDQTWLSVYLTEDPGSGSMNFHRISVDAVDVQEASTAEYRALARGLRANARYLTEGPGRDRLISHAEIYEGRV